MAFKRIKKGCTESFRSIFSEGLRLLSQSTVFHDVPLLWLFFSAAVSAIRPAIAPA